MNSRSTPAKSETGAKRAYRSDLRQKQAAATRRTILEAFGRLMGRPGARDFTMADVAREAGVAAATVFRQFGGRQELFDSFAAQAAERHGLTPRGVAKSLAAVPDLVSPLFAFYEEQGSMIRAAVRDPRLRALNEPARRAREKRLRQLVRRAHPELDEGEIRALGAVVQRLLSSTSWVHFVDEQGLSSADAARVVTRAVRAILADVAGDRVDRGGTPRPHEGE